MDCLYFRNENVEKIDTPELGLEPIHGMRQPAATVSALRTCCNWSLHRKNSLTFPPQRRTSVFLFFWSDRPGRRLVVFRRWT